MNAKNPLVPVEVNSELTESAALMQPNMPEMDDPFAIPRKVHGIMRGRYGWALGLGLFFAVVGGLAGALLPKPTYVSTGYIRVAPTGDIVLQQSDVTQFTPNYHNFVNSQVAIILSNRVVDQAMNHEKWRSTGRGNSNEEKADFYRNLQVRHPENSEGIIVQFEDENPSFAQKAVVSIIGAFQELYGEKDIQSLTNRMATLETLRSRYRDKVDSIRARRLAIGLEFGTDDLRTIYAAKQNLVNKIEAELLQIRLEYLAMLSTIQKQQGAAALAAVPPAPEMPAPPPKVVDVPAPGAAADSGKSDADGKTAQAPKDKEAKSDAAQAAPAKEADPLEALMKQATQEAKPIDWTIDNIAASDSTMRGYVQTRESLERSLEQLRLNLGEDHRQVQQTKTYLAAVSRDIEAYAADFRKRVAEGMAGAGPRELKQRQERFELVSKQYEQAKKELVEIGKKNLQLMQFDQDERDSEQNLKEVIRRIELLNIEQQTAGRIKVISEGDTPLEPYKDRRKIFAAIGIMFGMGMGFLIVLAVGLMDRRFRSIHDTTDHFSRISMLGILPRLPDDLADPDQAMIASRCVHQIRTLLQIGSDSQGRRVFVVTSPGPANGKTSLTLAMGLSFAASESKTLMIDCDLAGGGLTGRIDAIIKRKIGHILLREHLVTQEQLDHALRLSQENSRKLGEMLIELGYLTQGDLDEALTLQEETPVGLLDALQGDPLEHCVVDSGIANLSILPIGSATIDDVARLSPAAIRRLLDDARKQYDVVLIDTGAVPASLEASHLAPEADAVVLVVSKGENRAQAQKAIDHLANIGARIAGLVFNRAERRDMEVMGDSSLSKQSVSGVRRAPVKAEETETPNRFGPIARAVASGNVRGNSSRPG